MYISKLWYNRVIHSNLGTRHCLLSPEIIASPKIRRYIANKRLDCPTQHKGLKVKDMGCNEYARRILISSLTQVFFFYQLSIVNPARPWLRPPVSSFHPLHPSTPKNYIPTELVWQQPWHVLAAPKTNIGSRIRIRIGSLLIRFHPYQSHILDLALTNNGH